ncbi:putative bifunctional diguanylate cyclase/phosphodiesterase [Sulfuricystis multivorans]|uniref:putative bifunctional diguanylate cyclase/phosphodiesterase n=1 Tax=Sulfuricystis multivorans TaxID=2211108 RepID=UPI000F8304A5|nr:GGDEF domain-containing response regulator [Sulfuricystis multivorans]
MNARQHRILLIEDNPGDVRLVRELVREYGRDEFAVCEAGSLAAAIPLLSDEDIDIVVLDLNLPDGQGLATLEQMRELAPRVPVVVLSHLDDEREAVRAVRLGAQDFIVKQHLSGPTFLRALRYALERRQLEERLFHLAHRDPLTDLPNRRLFHDRFEHALAWARRHRQQLAFFFVDLDGFKNINDTLGHAAGDELLRETARRLTGLLRETDCVGRFGGDEFVIYAGELNGRADAEAIVAKLVETLSAPFASGGANRPIRASIGIALYPDDADDAETLIERADAAMYCAKTARGRAVRWCFYEARHDVARGEEERLAARLDEAWRRGEFRLVYQPQVDLASGRVIGVEALLRWQNEAGLQLPAVFMYALEKSGLIVSVGEWVIREACQAAAGWQQAAGQSVKVAVNLSPRQFRDPLLPDRIDEALRRSGLPARLLELEIGERSLREDEQHALAMLRRISLLGCRIALDNFRGEMMTLRDLQRFPIHALKLDRSIVADVGAEKGIAVAQAVISIAHVLKLRGVAEGVETTEQAQQLRAHAWDDAQGFVFGGPVPAEDVYRMLNHQAFPH